jgi:hypothetical protein
VEEGQPVNISRDYQPWSNDPYDPTLPPPLCFTRPAGSREQTGDQFFVGKMPKVTLRTPKLMMDPSDPMTWQRDYRFT